MTSRPFSDDERMDDQRLLGELASELREVAPLVGPLRQAGEAAYAWRGIDEELELASLVHDSALEAAPAVRAVEAESNRTLLFAGRSLSVQVECAGDSLVGQVIPPMAGELMVQGVDGGRDLVEVDDLGCFFLAELPAVPVRLRFRGATTRLMTDWIRF